MLHASAHLTLYVASEELLARERISIAAYVRAAVHAVAGVVAAEQITIEPEPSIPAFKVTLPPLTFTQLISVSISLRERFDSTVYAR